MESLEISEKDSKLLDIIEKMVTEAVAKGIKIGLEQAKNEERLKEKITFDIKFKNTRLLLKNYRKFVNFCEQATVSEKELESATVEEILDKLYCTAYDEVTIVQGILASKINYDKLICFILKGEEDKKAGIMIGTYEGYSYININYCPICGRKLGE